MWWTRRRRPSSPTTRTCLYEGSAMTYKHVLVVGAYAMSKYLDWSDKKTATIFADGAGAVVLRAGEERPGFLASKLVAEGSYPHHMGIYAGGTRMPVTENVLREGVWQKLRFANKYPAEVNTEGWPAIVEDVLKKAGLTKEDVSLFLFTQVNLSTIKVVMEKMSLPRSARTRSWASGATR